MYKLYFYSGIGCRNLFYSIEYFTIGNKLLQVDETDVTSNNYQTECSIIIEYGM